MRRRVRATLAAALMTTALAAGASDLAAQSAGDRAAVERAALDYIEGLYEGDPTKIERSVHPTLTKLGFQREDASADYAESPMTYEELIGFARWVKDSGNYPDASAPKEVRVLDVQDQTAAVKIRAWWGTDYMHLAKIDGSWMILHVLWQTLDS